MAEAPKFNRFENMYDPRLRPRILRALVREYLPYMEGPTPSHPEMSNVISAVRNFGLLSESLHEIPTDGELDALANDWKASVDSWVERLLELVYCDLPDKNWVGICMLGMTCVECTANRFSSSFAIWLDKILSHIERPSDFQSVKAASCNSISDLLTRLGGFTNLKKDGTSHAGKVFQLVLKLLQEDTSEAVLDSAIGLLCTIITYFPSPVLRHYANTEATIVSKIISGRSSMKLLKKYSQCLALLPKSKGDEEHWSLMMQKILLSLNAYVGDAFQGLERETQSGENSVLIVPPEEFPVPIGIQTMKNESIDHTTSRSKLFLTSTVPALMFCCCTMLTYSYPAQVKIPVRPLLTLIRRVLMVDGSLVQASFVMQQEFISPELPILHAYSLDLLIAIINGVGSQLLPLTAEIIRLVIWYFMQCALPELRIKLYSIIRILLTSMGIGVALNVANDVIFNACIDLDAAGYGIDTDLCSLFMQTGNEALLKKKKAEMSRRHSTSLISLKIAALETLKALLTVGGSLGSESLRSATDLLLATIATTACDQTLESEPVSTCPDFQIAALRAFLASLLSSPHIHPPFLSPGLHLFRKTKRKTGTPIAEFSAHALLTLEILMHPRHGFLPPPPDSSTPSHLNPDDCHPNPDDYLDHNVIMNACDGETSIPFDIERMSIGSIGGDEVMVEVGRGVFSSDIQNAFMDSEMEILSKDPLADKSCSSYKGDLGF